jgi:hypothetical protein
MKMPKKKSVQKLSNLNVIRNLSTGKKRKISLYGLPGNDPLIINNNKKLKK